MAEPTSDTNHPKVERRRYDLVGNVPQWIAAILLSIIGCLVLMIWNSMENRIDQVEKRLESVINAQATKNSDFEATRVRSVYLDEGIRKIELNQSQLSSSVSNLVTEVRVLNEKVLKSLPK